MNNNPIAGFSPQAQWGIIGAVIIGLTCLICSCVLGIYLLFSQDDDPQAVNNPTPFVPAITITSPLFPTAQPSQTPTLRPSATAFTSNPGNNNPPPAVQPTFPSNAGPAAYVTSQTLNVRSGPGTSFGILQTIGLNQLVGLVGRNNASDWVQVRLVNGTVGWVSAQFIRANVSLATLPVIQTIPTATATSQTFTPVIAIAPATGPAGTVITVLGTGYPPSVNVSIRLAITSTDFITAPYGTVLTSASGTFSGSFTMPSQWPDGSTITQTNLAVVARVDNTTYVDSENFTYQPSVSIPTITVNPNAGAANTDVSVSGSNFPANTTVEVRLASPTGGFTSSPYTTATTNASGAFSTTLTVPTHWTNGSPITEKDIQIVVTVAGNPSISAVVPFTYVLP
jgi:uncharacterized protein YgiM (DUF1202 family)